MAHARATLAVRIKALSHHITAKHGRTWVHTRKEDAFGLHCGAYTHENEDIRGAIVTTWRPCLGSRFRRRFWFILNAEIRPIRTFLAHTGVRAQRSLQVETCTVIYSALSQTVRACTPQLSTLLRSWLHCRVVSPKSKSKVQVLCLRRLSRALKILPKAVDLGLAVIH